MHFFKREWFRYLSVTDDDARWGVYMTGVGNGEFPADVPYEGSAHPAYYQYDFDKGRVIPECELVYIAEGEGFLESVAGGRMPVHAGDLILTPPGIWHRYAPNKETGWTEYWLLINGEEIHRLVREGFINSNCAVLEINDRSFLEGEYKSLMDRVQRKPQASHQIATAALQVLATSLDIGTPKSSTWTPISMPCATEDVIVARACQYIWNHHEPSINVNDVVKHLRVARRTLERRFRDHLGISIFDEIMKCRIERAKQMLSDTTLTLGEIANLSGFSRTYRMNTEFQKYEGLLPSTYRDRRNERES